VIAKRRQPESCRWFLCFDLSTFIVESAVSQRYVVEKQRRNLIAISSKCEYSFFILIQNFGFLIRLKVLSSPLSDDNLTFKNRASYIYTGVPLPSRCCILYIFFQQIRGRLISNAHSEIFCQRSKVAMRSQCVLVATTILHSGAKFHSFLYTGSKTVHVNMESCYGGMSTRLKQRAVTEFLSAANVTPAEIHRRLQAVYGENT